MRAALRYNARPELPQLAWVASANRSSGMVDVFHGASVERRPEWMVEGIWDDDFSSGGFDRSPHFFGSGVRVADGALVFVPSCGLVDRLLYCEDGRQLMVSNSLPLLLAYTGARLDPARDYRAAAAAIRAGSTVPHEGFAVLHPRIRMFSQLYEHGLWLDANAMDRVELRPARAAGSWADYRAGLTHALRQLHRNAVSPDRARPLPAFATLSTGYDSAAVCALVRDIGLKECFTVKRSNSPLPWWLAPAAAIDDGTPIARALGLRVIPLDTRRSRVTDDELYLLAAGCPQPSLALHDLARRLQDRGGPSVLFTGFQGDEVWDAHWEREFHDRGIVRGDPAGLGLGEIRLQTGFIHVPVPMLLARRIQDVAALTRSPEMAPWRLGTTYDRPIPRRIAESAGVLRQNFGQRKKAVVRAYAYPVHRPLRGPFWRYLRAVEQRSAAFAYFHVITNACLFFLVRTGEVMWRRVFPPARRPWYDPTPRLFVWTRLDLPRVLFRWAAQTLADRWRPVVRPRGTPVGPVAAPAAASAP